MRELTSVDISKNNVDTVSQYKILEYLKKNLNINEFRIYLVNRDTIKVVDKEDEHLYFNYNSSTKEVSYQDEFITHEKEIEMGL